MSEVGYIELARGLVSVTGADARSFLQGVISQDIERLAADRALYGALLTPQGKYLHDFCLAEVGERIILDGEAGRAQDLMARISRYRLRAKVDLALADDLAVFAVFGDGAAQVCGLAEEAGVAARCGDGVAFVDPRAVALGCRLILPAGEAADTLARLSLAPGLPEAYEALRISLGVPDGSRDMEVDKSTLLECNFEALNGVDWNKGCYVGQEVTARTKYRGLVKRALVPVSGAIAALSPGTAICRADSQVGEIRSICDGLALASLRLDALADDDGQPLLADGIVVTPLAR